MTKWLHKDIGQGFTPADIIMVVISLAGVAFVVWFAYGVAKGIAG